MNYRVLGGRDRWRRSREKKRRRCVGKLAIQLWHDLRKNGHHLTFILYPFSCSRSLFPDGEYLVKEIAAGTSRVESATYFCKSTFVKRDTLESYQYLKKIGNPKEKEAAFEVIASLIVKGQIWWKRNDSGYGRAKFGVGGGQVGKINWQLDIQWTLNDEVGMEPHGAHLVSIGGKKDIGWQYSPS